MDILREKIAEAVWDCSERWIIEAETMKACQSVADAILAIPELKEALAVDAALVEYDGNLRDKLVGNWPA